MKTLTALCLCALSLFGQCKSKIGGTICNGGAACTAPNGGAGTCRNLAASGQIAQCGCLANYVPPPAPTVNLSVNPPSITVGQPATLTWSTTSADTVSILPTLGTVAASGSAIVYPQSTTTYGLFAQNSIATAATTATVQVSTITVYPYPPVPTLTADLNAASWYFDYPPSQSIYNPATGVWGQNLYNLPGPVLAFDFPQIDLFVAGQGAPYINPIGQQSYWTWDFVSYVMTNPLDSTWRDISQKSSVLATVNLVAVGGGARTFNYQLNANNTCTYPAEMHLILAADDWDTVDNHAIESTDQQYQTPSYSITMQVGVGPQALTVPLDPKNWIFRVSGQRASSNPTDWQYVLTHLTKVGVTFGGGCFYAHGVNVSGGPVQMQISNLQVQ